MVAQEGTGVHGSDYGCMTARRNNPDKFHMAQHVFYVFTYGRTLISEGFYDGGK